MTNGLSKKEKCYFNAAKAVSYLSDRKVRVGAVVVSQHKIVSSGCNSNTRTDALQAKIDTEYFGENCTGKLHAETSCLIPAIKRKIDLSGATIFVYREHKDGTIAMARPCARCMKIIRACGIKRIKYTTEDGYADEHIKY